MKTRSGVEITCLLKQLLAIFLTECRLSSVPTRLPTWGSYNKNGTQRFTVGAQSWRFKLSSFRFAKNFLRQIYHIVIQSNFEMTNVHRKVHPVNYFRALCCRNLISFFYLATIVALFSERPLVKILPKLFKIYLMKSKDLFMVNLIELVF